MNLKVIYYKDDLKRLYENEILSYKHQIAIDIPLVYREFLLRVLMRLIPNDIEIDVRKVNERRNPYFPD